MNSQIHNSKFYVWYSKVFSFSMNGIPILERKKWINKKYIKNIFFYTCCQNLRSFKRELTKLLDYKMISIFLKLLIFMYMCMCVFWQHFFVETCLIKYYWHPWLHIFILTLSNRRMHIIIPGWNWLMNFP